MQYLTTQLKTQSNIACNPDTDKAWDSFYSVAH